MRLNYHCGLLVLWSCIACGDSKDGKLVAPEAASESSENKSTELLTLENNQVGNGGDAIVCPGKQNKLLDFYEAELRWKLKVDLGSSSLTVMEKVQLAIGRLEKHDPYRFAELKKLASTFEKEAAFWEDIELVDVPDSNHIGISADCQLKQLAIQKAPNFLHDSYYIINQDIYKNLSNDHQAGLILHELIYRTFIPYGVQESTLVRYFNAIISSNELSKISQLDYLKILGDLPFTYVDKNLIFYAASIKLSEKDALNEGRLYEVYKFNSHGGEIKFAQNHVLELWQNGTIKSGHPSETSSSSIYKLTEDCELDFDTRFDGGDRLYFDENGRLWKGLTLADPGFHWLCIPGLGTDLINIGGRPPHTSNTNTHEDWTFEFHPSGVVKSLRLGTEEELIEFGGNSIVKHYLLYVYQYEKVSFCPDTVVNFWDNGLVESGEICPIAGSAYDLNANDGTFVSVTTRTSFKFDKEGRVILK